MTIRWWIGVVIATLCAGSPLQASAQACVRFFALASNDKVGLRNNCDQCKVAVINDTVFDPFPQPAGTLSNKRRKERVEAHSDREVQRANRSSEIIGEEPCPK